MRPVDIQVLAVRAMDVGRMQAAFLAAEAVQQEQRARKGQEELAEQQAQVKELQKRPGSAGAEDAAPLSDRQRAAERPAPRARRRTASPDDAADSTQAPFAPSSTGLLIDEYR